MTDSSDFPMKWWVIKVRLTRVTNWVRMGMEGTLICFHLNKNELTVIFPWAKSTQFFFNPEKKKWNVNQSPSITVESGLIGNSFLAKRCLVSQASPVEGSSQREQLWIHSFNISPIQASRLRSCLLEDQISKIHTARDLLGSSCWPTSGEECPNQHRSRV